MYVCTCVYPSLVLSRQEAEREAAISRRELEQKLQIQERMVRILNMRCGSVVCVLHNMCVSSHGAFVLVDGIT